MLCYSVLLDGGFLKRKLGTAHAPATAQDITAFTERLRGIPELVANRLHRVYFYDAAPSTETVRAPFGGPAIALGNSKSHAHNASLHAQLAKHHYFALRLGELAVRGWKPKQRLQNIRVPSLELTHDNIKLDIQQKGVDMRIGLDIAALTLKKISQVIVLVTADSDFIPAMKFARREGAQLILVTLGNAVSQRMFEHADVVHTAQI